MHGSLASGATPTLRGVFPRIATILSGNAILTIANSLFSTLISIRLLEAGFPATSIGLVQSAYYGGFLLGALSCGALIGRIGHHRAFAIFAALLACSALGHVVYSHPWTWAALRLLAGFCMVGVFTVVESWLHAAAGNRLRGQVFSLYLILDYLCAGAAQLLLNVTDPIGYKLFTLIAVLFALSLIPVLLAGKQQAGEQTSTAGACRFWALRQWYRSAPLGIWACVTAGMLNGAFYALGPVFMRGLGYSVAGISHFMGGAMIAALLLQWPIGRWSDRSDRRLFILAVTLLTSLVCLLILALRAKAGFEMLVYVYISLAFTLYGLASSHANDAATAEQHVDVSTWMLLLFSIGGLLGPSAAALLMKVNGPMGYFIFVALVAASLGVYAGYILRRRPPLIAAA